MNGKELVEAIQKIPGWESKLAVVKSRDRTHFYRHVIIEGVEESGDDEFKVTTEE